MALKGALVVCSVDTPLYLGGTLGGLWEALLRIPLGGLSGDPRGSLKLSSQVRDYTMHLILWVTVVQPGQGSLQKRMSENVFFFKLKFNEANQQNGSQNQKVLNPLRQVGSRQLYGWTSLFAIALYILMLNFNNLPLKLTTLVYYRASQKKVYFFDISA